MATLAAVGGTIMQIVGVYSADICYITVDHWMDPFRPGITALISSNSKRMIQDAQIYWKPCAITAIVFMSFVSFVGWCEFSSSLIRGVPTLCDAPLRKERENS